MSDLNQCNPGEDRISWDTGLANGTIIGVVMECETVQPAVLVHIPGKSLSVYTDSLGTFELSDVPQGTYDLSVEPMGQTPTQIPKVKVMSGLVNNLGPIKTTNLTSDVNNCGQCGNACSTINATASCVDSACEIKCNPNFEDCNLNIADGCETNINDPAHCGSCNNNCGPPAPSVSVTCYAGKCSRICIPASLDCDGNRDNGCETNINDPAHCGGCDHNCGPPAANRNVACVAGVCWVSCFDGFFDCDGNLTNGCESTAPCG